MHDGVVLSAGSPRCAAMAMARLGSQVVRIQIMHDDGQRDRQHMPPPACHHHHLPGSGPLGLGTPSGVVSGETAEVRRERLRCLASQTVLLSCAPNARITGVVNGSSPSAAHSRERRTGSRTARTGANDAVFHAGDQLQIVHRDASATRASRSSAAALSITGVFSAHITAGHQQRQFFGLVQPCRAWSPGSFVEQQMVQRGGGRHDAQPSRSGATPASAVSQRLRLRNRMIGRSGRFSSQVPRR